jgi:hypothetical protein
MSDSNSRSGFDLPPSHQTTFLLPLPPEIRTIIYTLILPPPTTIHPKVDILFRSAENGRRFRTHEKVLGLARTCQTFYAEFLPLYYHTNTFSFSSAYDLYRYLYMIGPYRRSCVRKIEFWLRAGIEHWWRTKAHEIYEWAAEMLSQCNSLERLGIGVSAETKEGMKGPVKGLEGLRGMGLQRLDLKVKEVYDWGPWALNAFGAQNEEVPRNSLCVSYFMPEQLMGLEKRLWRYMTTKKEDVVEEEDTAGGVAVIEADKKEVGPKAVRKRGKMGRTQHGSGRGRGRKGTLAV